MPNAAEELFEELADGLWGRRELTIEDIPVQTSWEGHAVIFAATGPPRIGHDELVELREAVVAAAREAGFPDKRPGDPGLNAFDRAVGRVWLERGMLFPTEAAVPEIWSFHALVLLPDVAFWRFPPARRADTRPNRERFVGSDLTRHVFGRLWWRGCMVTKRARDSEAALELLGVLGEADLDQILSRRRAYGGSPEVFRGILETWKRRSSESPLRKVATTNAGRDVLREFLKRLLRRGAFVALDLLEEDALHDALDQMVSEVLVEGPTSATSVPTDTAAQPSPQEQSAGDASLNGFDAVPLKDLVVHITKLVEAMGEVPPDEVAAGLRQSLDIEIPAKRTKIIRRMAWTAAGFGYLVHDEEREVWLVGDTKPGPDRRWGEWTLDAVRRRAEELRASHEDPSTELLAELFSGKPNKLAKDIVKVALAEADGRQV